MNNQPGHSPGGPTLRRGISGRTDWGVASESPDGAAVSGHVLRPLAAGSTLELAAPRHRRTFATAHLPKEGKPMTLTQNGTGVSLTLPAGESWDPLDAVLALAWRVESGHPHE